MLSIIMTMIDNGSIFGFLSKPYAATITSSMLQLYKIIELLPGYSVFLYKKPILKFSGLFFGYVWIRLPISPFLFAVTRFAIERSISLVTS